MTRQQSPIRIGIVVFERCQIVDATGSAGVFGVANEILKDTLKGAAGYDIRLLAVDAGQIRTSSGVSLFADHALNDRLPPFNTLICVGGKGTQNFAADASAIAAVRKLAGKAQRIVSVCTGAFILAAAGLLDGKRAVTHWAHCQKLAADYPRITVEQDPIYIKDGNVYTSAGVTAGMDLALALVESDYGRDVALAAARDMVMFMKRPGSQAQYSAYLAAQTAPSGTIRDMQLWLLENIDRDIDVETLADKAAMSPRTFYRQFKKSTGLTPARFIADCRLDAARRLIEESPMAVKSIAQHCGFGDPERMRRAFQRTFGISPDDYRRRFSSTLLN